MHKVYALAPVGVAMVNISQYLQEQMDCKVSMAISHVCHILSSQVHWQRCHISVMCGHGICTKEESIVAGQPYLASYAFNTPPISIITMLPHFLITENFF